MRNGIGIATLVLSAALVGGSVAQAEEPILNVYNWSDYIAEDTIANFEKETGIKVNYDVFDSNEVLEAKLLAGKTGYDVVVPSGGFLERQIKAGVFLPIDKSKLKNYGNLDPDILKRLAQHDPGNKYGVPYMWGTTGFAYNTKMIEQRMANAPVDSWDMMFNPDVVSKFADCGVTFLDAPGEVFSAAIKYIGRDPNDFKKENLEAAYEMLLKVRPYIKYFHSSQNINDLANGDICLAHGWSGDMFMAMDRAAEAGQGVEIAYTIPKEGAVIWFDSLAIPADAPHPENALKFIDYILRPEVTAAISNYVFYANANIPATELVDPDIRSDPGIYPTEEAKASLFADLAVPARYERTRTRLWTRLKTGQ